MHQNVAVILRQFIYAKNIFIVLIPGEAENFAFSVKLVVIWKSGLEERYQTEYSGLTDPGFRL